MHILFASTDMASTDMASTDMLAQIHRYASTEVDDTEYDQVMINDPKVDCSGERLICVGKSSGF
jgi:hypothetical protein